MQFLKTPFFAALIILAAPITAKATVTVIFSIEQTFRVNGNESNVFMSSGWNLSVEFAYVSMSNGSPEELEMRGSVILEAMNPNYANVVNRVSTVVPPNSTVVVDDYVAGALSELTSYDVLTDGEWRNPVYGWQSLGPDYIGIFLGYFNWA